MDVSQMDLKFVNEIMDEYSDVNSVSGKKALKPMTW